MIDVPILGGGAFCNCLVCDQGWIEPSTTATLDVDQSAITVSRKPDRKPGRAITVYAWQSGCSVTPLRELPCGDDDYAFAADPGKGALGDIATATLNDSCRFILSQ
jgi:hypothetical protein